MSASIITNTSFQNRDLLGWRGIQCASQRPSLGREGHPVSQWSQKFLRPTDHPDRYFSHSKYTGLALFRRRPTPSRDHRGFRLSSLGILLADTQRPKPWLHLTSLQSLADRMYASASDREAQAVANDGEGSSGASDQQRRAGELIDKDWEHIREWFTEHEAKDDSTIPDGGAWAGWSNELNAVSCLVATLLGHISDLIFQINVHNPSLHLSHLLRILGPSSMTLYKFVLSRRRVMIYTLPPVEVSCMLSWLAADLCREYHMSPEAQSQGIIIEDLLLGLHPFQRTIFPSSDYSDHLDTLPHESRKRKDSPRVLGMVTLSDLDRLLKESQSGRGWIASKFKYFITIQHPSYWQRLSGTTDAIFLEKASYYDLIIDLTTSTPNGASRPTLHISKPISPSSSGNRKQTWKLETVRFTWSDLKLV